MISAIARISTVCVTCLIFLFLASTVSFAKTLHIFGDNGKDFTKERIDAVAAAGGWNDNGSTWDSDGWNDDGSVLIPEDKNPWGGLGSGHAFFPRVGEIPEIGDCAGCEDTAPRPGGVQILFEPTLDNEFRYLTYAVKMDPPGDFAVIKFNGFPGFHPADFHPDACWDHQIIHGDPAQGPFWNTNTDSFIVSDGSQAYITAFGTGDQTQWNGYIVDLVGWSEAECPYNDDCAAGEWDLNSPSIEGADSRADGANLANAVAGEIRFDVVYLTQTMGEAQAIIDSGGTAVEAAGKLSTTWGKIKEQ